MKNAIKLGLFALVLGALAYSSTALAKKSGGGAQADLRNQAGEYDEIYSDGTTLEASGLRACPRDIQCPDVYDPVTCSNGVTYPNACYAYRACATGCGGGGGGGT